MQCSKNIFGALDRRVTIQAVTQTPDGQGGQTEVWVSGDTIWASIDPMKGWERMQAAQLQTPLTHKVTIRYRSGFSTKQRLLYGSRIFNIKEIINPNEGNVLLILRCIETT